MVVVVEVAIVTEGEMVVVEMTVVVVRGAHATPEVVVVVEVVVTGTEAVIAGRLSVVALVPRLETEGTGVVVVVVERVVVDTGVAETGIGVVTGIDETGLARHVKQPAVLFALHSAHACVFQQQTLKYHYDICSSWTAAVVGLTPSTQQTHGPRQPPTVCRIPSHTQPCRCCSSDRRMPRCRDVDADNAPT